MPAGPHTPSRYAVRGLAVLLSFLVASGPLRARAESNLFPDVYRDLENAAPPKVVVLAVSLDKEADKRLGLLEGVTERAVDNSERFQLSPLGLALDPEATKGRQQQQLKAEQALKDGQKALDDLDAVKALKLADDAIAFAKAGEPATKRGFETYVQAAVMRAAAMVANGDTAAAKTEIEKILVFAPKAAFPDSSFPPELIKHAEATRKKLAAATGTIVVRSDPPGARVHLDGVFRGYAPVNVSGFAPGNHLAVAQLGGYQTIAGEIPVDDQTVKLKPAEANSRLQLARDKVKKDPDGPGRDQAARDFGRLLSADQVVIVVARAGLTPGKLELIAERIEVRDGHNDAFHSGSVEPAPEPLATFVGSVLGSDAPRDGGKAVAHFGGGGGSGSGGSGKFILGISLLGVAVIGLGSGIYCGLQASDRAAQYKKTPQVQTVTSANLASEGRTFSIIADISYVVAVLAAAAGTFFLVTSRSKSSPQEAPPPEKETKKAPPPQETKKTESPPDDAKKKTDDATAKKKAEDDAAAKKKADDDTKKAEEEKKPEKKMTEKERRAEEKRLKAEEKKRAEEERKEEKRRKEEEAKQAKEDKKRAEEQKKADEAAKKKADEEAAAAAKRKKSDEEDEAAVAAMKKKADEDAAKKKADDSSGKKKAEDDAAAKKKADDDAAAKKKADDDAAAKKKTDDSGGKKKTDNDTAAKKNDQPSSKADDEEKRKKEEQRRKQQQDDEDLKNQ